MNVISMAIVLPKCHRRCGQFYGVDVMFYVLTCITFQILNCIEINLLTQSFYQIDQRSQTGDSGAKRSKNQKDKEEDHGGHWLLVSSQYAIALSINQTCTLVYHICFNIFQIVGKQSLSITAKDAQHWLSDEAQRKANSRPVGKA